MDQVFNFSKSPVPFLVTLVHAMTWMIENLLRHITCSNVLKQECVIPPDLQVNENVKSLTSSKLSSPKHTQLLSLLSAAQSMNRVHILHQQKFCFI